MSSNFCWPWWYRQKNRTTVSSAMLYLSRVETRGETRVKMVKRRAAGREREEFGVGMGKTSQIAFLVQSFLLKGISTSHTVT